VQAYCIVAPCRERQRSEVEMCGHRELIVVLPRSRSQFRTDFNAPAPYLACLYEQSIVKYVVKESRGQAI
jgi:hypothetical protein